MLRGGGGSNVRNNQPEVAQCGQMMLLLPWSARRTKGYGSVSTARLSAPRQEWAGQPARARTHLARSRVRPLSGLGVKNLDQFFFVPTVGLSLHMLMCKLRRAKGTLEAKNATLGMKHALYCIIIVPDNALMQLAKRTSTVAPASKLSH